MTVAKKGHTEEQILRALRQAEGGTRVADICREHGISEATFYIWKKKYSAGGAAAGDLTGALIGMGIPEYEAKRYEGKVKGGNILLSVHTDDSNQRERAKEIFTKAGAEV